MRVYATGHYRRRFGQWRQRVGFWGHTRSLLVGLINQAMVYLKIPTSWGDAFLGTVFIAFIFSQSLEGGKLTD